MKYLAILILAVSAAGAQSALADGENHWHVSTYWAEYIEGHGPGNHALYCGDEMIPACAPPDTMGGVGPDWLDDVEWRSIVADPRRPATVRLTGLMNYDLPDLAWDFLELYIQRGDELDLLAATRFPAGSHAAPWDGRDDRGQAVASGIYFYRFSAGRESRVGKLTMLK